MEQITSRRNPLCLHLKKLGESRGYREQSGEFLCDGLKLLEEAIRSNAYVTTVLTASRVVFPLQLDTRLHYTERNLIDSLSPLKHAQDTLFACKIQHADAAFEPGAHILLDGVQDPGNVGTIIRTANAFGIKSVILADGCADPYNPKSVRASMGAIFRQKIRFAGASDLIALKENGIRFVGAAIGGGCLDVSELDLKDTIIAIGSERRGLSKEVLSLCDERLTIPMSPECESLNASVAAAIIMWEASKPH